MDTLSKGKKGRRKLSNDSTWNTKHNLDDFFSVLGQINSSGVSAIITKEERKENDERNERTQ